MKTILLTNDDGFFAPGIAALNKALVDGYDISIVAPETEQSGVGHAFTFSRPIRCQRAENNELIGHAVSGTPADCVKIAIGEIIKQLPDLVVSGMNIGENSGLSGYYSGTVAAAREGAFWGVLSVAFSVCIEGKQFLDDYCVIARKILNTIVENQATKSDAACGIFYNVNFPGCSPRECRGIRITRQSLAFFDDQYKSVPLEDGSNGYLVYGEKKNVESSDDYDSRALLNNYITITPLNFDNSAIGALSHCTTVGGSPVCKD